MLKAGNLFSFQGDKASSGANKAMLVLLMATPAISLGAYWIGGEQALLIEALVAPIILFLAFLFLGGFSRSAKSLGRKDRLDAAGFETLAKMQMDTARANGEKTAIFYVCIDDFDTLHTEYGDPVFNSVSDQIRNRVRAHLRDSDAVCAINQSTFAICLSPQGFLDLEVCLELSGRISRGLCEPYIVENETLYLTVSMGFCQLGRETAREADKNAEPVNRCAADALAAALASSPGAIRAYTPDTKVPTQTRKSEGHCAIAALEAGEIVPWFQPQVSTDTGQITGFEALARWMHPVDGPVSPGEFLPKLEEAGLMSRLFEVMIYNSFSALKAWDDAGLEVEQIGVNFSSDELSDPKLVEKITWELDRFELEPQRLAVEILETVVAKGPDDVITRNIKALSALGCRIDLDDFGSGHASLASISRFGVGRIKIDRSFVMKADRDADQQRMIRAILTMAEKLDIETLAEGVETVGEHSLLAQLGCTYVQGFGIGRPMAFDQTFQWVAEHNAKLQAPPEIGRATG